MRLIFIPGFGEDPRIFSQLAPLLPGEKLFIHNLDLLGTEPTPTITVVQYAQQLIDTHQISPEDILIGHSMGGWIAFAIKHLTGCSIVQIASWTDPEKVLLPIKNPDVLQWLIRKELYFNRFTRHLILWLNYRHQPSAQVMSDVFQNLINSPKGYISNQLRIILNPVELATTLKPDVRIHARQDTIVRFPNESAYTVPGDHFGLVTHPKDVAVVLINFLRTKGAIG